MTCYKIFNEIILGVLLMSSSFLYSQDGALSAYRVSLDLSDTKTESPQDSLIGIEFYSGTDGEMKCNAVHLIHSRKILKYDIDSLKFEILNDCPLKYNALAQCKLESSLLFTALLAIY